MSIPKPVRPIVRIPSVKREILKAPDHRRLIRPDDKKVFLEGFKDEKGKLRVGCVRVVRTKETDTSVDTDY